MNTASFAELEAELHTWLAALWPRILALAIEAKPPRKRAEFVDALITYTLVQEEGGLRVLSAAAATVHVARHLGKLVGVDGLGARMWTVYDLIGMLRQRLAVEILADRRLPLEPWPIDAWWAPMRAWLEGDAMMVELIVPFAHLASSVGAIRLAENAWLKEVARADGSPPTVTLTDNSAWLMPPATSAERPLFGLHVLHEAKKSIGDPPTGPEAEAKSQQLHDRLGSYSRVLSWALRLLPIRGGTFPVPIGRAVRVLDAVGNRQMGNYSVLHVPPPDFNPYPVQLDAQAGAPLAELWARLNDRYFEGKPGRSIALALDRLVSAETRDVPEDALVDLVVTLEILTGLGIGGPAGDLALRTALYASLFFTDAMTDALPRAEIYALVRQAYRYRSQLVHGSAGTDPQRRSDLLIVNGKLRPLLGSVLQEMAAWKPTGSQLESLWERRLRLLLAHAPLGQLSATPLS